MKLSENELENGLEESLHIVRNEKKERKDFKVSVEGLDVKERLYT